MINKCLGQQYELYNAARDHFISNPDLLIALEHHISNEIFDSLDANKETIREEYNEASFLYPFWQNYPPDDRGRAPRKDQYPWIEVGEHVLGAKLPRLLTTRFDIKDYGIPTGPDERFVLCSDKISSILNNYTNCCWAFIDIKSVGPRDDAPHAVMSHNQISGDGRWSSEKGGIINVPIKAQGRRATHDFYCAMPPIYVTSRGEVLPVVQMVIKPIYDMTSGCDDCNGQPLSRIEVITIPNGILLYYGPEYLKKYPRLFYPGKDDKTKNKKKIRARVSFDLLQKIDNWRVRVIQL